MKRLKSLVTQDTYLAGGLDIILNRLEIYNDKIREMKEDGTFIFTVEEAEELLKLQTDAILVGRQINNDLRIIEDLLEDK